MHPVLLHEVKYYFNNTKEAIHLIGLFFVICMLFLFSIPSADLKNQWVASSLLWVALTVTTALGGAALFQRDHDSGRLEYYQLAQGHLWGVILAKWVAYYLFVTMPLLLILPVVALLVDIPVGVWAHYAIGLASGAMALSLLSALIAAVMTGLEKVGGLLALVMLPLTIPVIIFGTSYLANTEILFQTQLLFLWGFSLILMPILCVAGASCIRAAN